MSADDPRRLARRRRRGLIERGFTVTSLVHIGDFHAAPGPRNADRYRALDQIIAEGSALPHLGAWLWPGDLFDAASYSDDRNAIDQRIQRMAAVAPVLICYGNHDRPGDLDGFGRLDAEHPIYVFDRPHVHFFRLATREMAACFVLPYPHKSGLVSAGVAVGDVVETAGDLLEPIFMAAADRITQAREQGLLVFMIGHVNVAGAVASTGQPNVGREIELNPKHLERLGRIPKLLNHIHKPQEIAGVHYAGSVCRLSYGEIEPKRWLEVGVELGSWGGFGGDGPEDGDERQVYDLLSHPIDVAPMFQIEGRLSPSRFAVDVDQVADEIKRRIVAHDWAGCDVRVRYEYLASEKSSCDIETVRALFAGALRLKLEGVAILDRELRSPAVAAAKTIPDKLAAYMGLEALPASTAAKVDLLLSLQSPEALAAIVRQQVSELEAPRPELESVTA